ncbi:unnamed protein product [Nesidiocoris tenuis]|uniref:Uncharacterized protein n=1 Tax=Nesidiocoris tenuis TaxID=355587 RepID=A0A6H5GIN9_9HEMI|nr:unnamed protein product [Nesidiocoris tenuis]
MRSEYCKLNKTLLDKKTDFFVAKDFLFAPTGDGNDWLFARSCPGRALPPSRRGSERRTATGTNGNISANSAQAGRLRA